MTTASRSLTTALSRARSLAACSAELHHQPGRDPSLLPCHIHRSDRHRSQYAMESILRRRAATPRSCDAETCGWGGGRTSGSLLPCLRRIAAGCRVLASVLIAHALRMRTRCVLPLLSQTPNLAAAILRCPRTFTFFRSSCSSWPIPLCFIPNVHAPVERPECRGIDLAPGAWRCRRSS